MKFNMPSRVAPGVDARLHLHVCRMLSNTPGDELSGACGGDMDDACPRACGLRRCSHKLLLASAVYLSCREVCLQVASRPLEFRERAVASLEGTEEPGSTQWRGPPKACASSEYELGTAGGDECIVA